MRSKAAAKRARAINQFLDPSLKPDEASKKLGHHIAPNRRDFHKILMLIETQMRREDPTLPRQISLGHYKVVQKLFQYAMRDNEASIQVKCPKCQEKLEVPITDSKTEKNSVTALEILTDRMFPKLASLTHEVNIHNTIINITTGLATIVAKYVPQDQRLNCNIELRALFESAKAASNGNQQPIEVPYSITG